MENRDFTFAGYGRRGKPLAVGVRLIRSRTLFYGANSPFSFIINDNQRAFSYMLNVFFPILRFYNG
jgi:hypothetical protein